METLQRTKVIGSIAYMGGIMSVPEPFAWSWSQMVEFNHSALCENGERIHYDRSRLSLHDYARNELVGRMLGDFLLMLDTDMQFEPDFAARLVHQMYAHDLDVVTGLYQFKGGAHAPVLWHDNVEGDRLEIIGKWDETVDLFPIGSAGAGCLLLRRRALERIRLELKVNPFSRIDGKGEDHSFFERLKKLGIPAYCAWKVQAGHLDYKPIGMADRSEAMLIGEYEVESLRS